MTGDVQRLASIALAAGLVAVAAAPAWAQTIPEGQSCGGLLCDMGIFGHKTTPPAAVTAAPATASTPATAAAAPEAAALPSPAHRRGAKAPVARRRVAKATPTKQAPAVARVSPLEVSPLKASASGAPPAERTGTRSMPSPASRDATAVSSPPMAARAYQRPLIFQSIDPMLQ